MKVIIIKIINTQEKSVLLGYTLTVCWFLLPTEIYRTTSLYQFCSLFSLMLFVVTCSLFIFIFINYDCFVLNSTRNLLAYLLADWLNLDIESSEGNFMENNSNIVGLISNNFLKKNYWWKRKKLIKELYRFSLYFFISWLTLFQIIILCRFPYWYLFDQE